jgi:hypothetical protein
MTSSSRIQVKFYANHSPEPDAFIPVFHRFIRENVLDELAIDVADYGHVHEGPGVVLIGHAYDYYWDLGEGRPGLVYTRKRDAPAPDVRLTDAVRRALVGCKLLEQDPALKGLSFRTDEMLVRLPDRLHAPPTDAGYSALQTELGSLISKVYAGATMTIGRVGGPREMLGARVKVGPGATISELLARIS